VLLLFYALFIAAIALSFEEWWPVWVFAWLMVSKALWIFIAPRDRAAEMERQMKAWAFSTVAYLAAVFLTLVLPIPELGITASIQPELGLSGGGEWIDHPHIAVAGMAFYYFANAWFKWWSGGRAADNRA
jgi:cobalamin synthase